MKKIENIAILVAENRLFEALRRQFPSYKFLREGENVLEAEVTNLSANRVADLDRRGVVWKKFYDINFVNINYDKFDASEWPAMDSGLLGPVRLMPQAVLECGEP